MTLATQQVREEQALAHVLFSQLEGERRATAGLQPDRAETVSDAELEAYLRTHPVAGPASQGDFSAFGGDNSSADLAVINAMAPKSGNRAQVKRVFMGLPIARRDKVLKRRDYLDRTVELAFDRVELANRVPSAFTVGGQPFVPGVVVPVAPTARPPQLSWPPLAQITGEEWFNASASPRAIVLGLIYQDVGNLIAAGGTGKTTLMLWLALHIVLGIDFAGRAVMSPGRVVILTAEDSREMLVARLRDIFNSMFPHGGVAADERSAAFDALIDGMVILDVSANVRRLTMVDRDVVRIDQLAIDELTGLIAPLNPALLVIDPAVSFGVGESRVNDAEQGLIEAGRRLRRNVGCAVLFVHHTGKVNGREQSEDQYSGRGGSAFADGSRMVFVLNKLKPDKWQTETGTELSGGEVGLKLTIAKLSYCGPQPPIYIVRYGYGFRMVEPATEGHLVRRNHDDDTVLAFIIDETAAGQTYSRNKLEQQGLELSRKRLRDAVGRLLEDGRLIEREDKGKGLALIPTVATAPGDGTGK